MIDGIRFKVCGLTSLVDAEFADKCGADFLGFILHPKSPRYIPLDQFRAMAGRLPERKKVAVMVEPSESDLTQALAAGFDRFQIHFRPEWAIAERMRSVQKLTPDRLWLAPRLPSGQDVPAELLPLADTFLLDTFHPDKFGGTGETGDWGKFARHRQLHRAKTWILSGGLNPQNIGDALRGSGARFVDVNSGVEAAPGVKDETKLKSFVVRLHEAMKPS